MRILLALLPFWALASGDSCFHTCPKNRAPVCAHSPAHGHTTFSNRCLMDYANQCKNGRHIFLHDGDCSSNENEGPSHFQHDCNQRICTREHRPLCGRSDRNGFKTFPNTCTFEIANQCDNEGYVKQHNGPCNSNEKEGRNANLRNGSSSSNNSERREEGSAEWGSNSCENRGCTREYLPVCARSSTHGYKTFANRCIMNQANQCRNRGYSVQREGRCTPSELNSSSSEEDSSSSNSSSDNSCQRNRGCVKEYTPVCARSNSKGWKTFNNFCLMEKANECHKSGYTVQYEGRCRSSDRSGSSSSSSSSSSSTSSSSSSEEDIQGRPSCQKPCTKELNPVCAHSPSRGFKTFDTRCVMERENQCYNGNYNFVHTSRCNDNEKQGSISPMDAPCSTRGCTLEYAPICARSPTKGRMTFSTRCLMKYQNDCRQGDFSFERDGRCSAANNDNENMAINPFI